ncbi:glycosyltransferase family 4 protein, partial [Methanobrevibacter sp. OttesenSCG-928-K11]|nr:glycosyltransferase family 4 protein [Methanobrevibacter sp. OttesenSCG-928-K11]
MKIVLLGQFSPDTGGISTHINNLALKLINDGQEVYIITRFNKKRKSMANIPGINIIEVDYINIPGLISISFYLNAKKALEKLIKRTNIDI